MIQKIEINGEMYAKMFFDDAFGGSFEYYVYKTKPSGKVVMSRLNPAAHRYAIAKINTALATKA